MLSTIGAILLSIQTTIMVSVISRPPLELFPTQTPIAYQQNPILVAVVDHYNTKGIWAGTFKIDNIIKFKIIKTNESESVAHVVYHYVFVPNNAKNRTDSGYDHRTFTVSHSGDTVKVIKMGPYKSATF